MTPAAMTAAALAAPALLPPTEAGIGSPGMQQLQAMGSGSHAGGGPSWWQPPAQHAPAPPLGGLLHTVAGLQPPHYALLAQCGAHHSQQQQGQQQQEQACLDFYNLKELQAAARFAVTEGTSALAATVESVGNGTAAGDEFDLPEEDTLLRQALEQHLDAALCVAVAADLQNAHTMQGEQQQQQQQQTDVPMDADTVMDVAATVAAAAAAAINLANGAQLGPKRQRSNGSNHLPPASQPPHMLPPGGFPPPPEWGQAASVGRANSFPGGLEQGPESTAQHSVQPFRRSTSGLRFMTASDQGITGNGDANWGRQQQQQVGWVPHGPQAEGQQQPWAPQHHQQQYYGQLADQQQRQQSPIACPPPTWDQVNLLLQRVQALEQQQQLMHEEVMRLKVRSGDG
jgi:hypothetical protein